MTSMLCCDSDRLALLGLLCCLPLLCPAPSALAQASQEVQAAGPVPKLPSIRLASAEETESAWFRLDSEDRDPEGDARPVGIARWISGPLDPKDPEKGRRLELELRWLGSDVRLMITERILPNEHRVLWREQLQRGGRTVMISVDRSQLFADLLVTETAAGKVRRRSLSRDLGAWQLLSLIESAGRGAEPHGPTRILMPQKAAVETVELRLDLDSSPKNKRRLSLILADGTPGPSFRFEGREFMGFTWQAGGPVATRISAQEHARWVRSSVASIRAQD